MLRRSFERLLAVVLFALLSPIFLIVALGEVLTSGRPVLFRQDRAGLGGNQFTLLKFRAMSDER